MFGISSFAETSFSTLGKIGGIVLASAQIDADATVTANALLFPNLSNAEYTTAGVETDILSNGFKLRTTNGDGNKSGDTFIYAAFAENPFKNANAR